jgi:hypothetical protein
MAGRLASTDRAVKAYLSHGLELGIDTRYLTSHRLKWYLVESVEPPHLFLVPVGKPSHRTIINDALAVGSNNFYGIYLNKDAPWSREGLAQWLRSAEGLIELSELARHYHGGSLKIEPGALRTLRIPDTLEEP